MLNDITFVWPGLETCPTVRFMKLLRRIFQPLTYSDYLKWLTDDQAKYDRTSLVIILMTAVLFCWVFPIIPKIFAFILLSRCTIFWEIDLSWKNPKIPKKFLKKFIFLKKNLRRSKFAQFKEISLKVRTQLWSVDIPSLYGMFSHFVMQSSVWCFHCKRWSIC